MVGLLSDHIILAGATGPTDKVAAAEQALSTAGAKLVLAVQHALYISICYLAGGRIGRHDSGIF